MLCFSGNLKNVSRQVFFFIIGCFGRQCKQRRAFDKPTRRTFGKAFPHIRHKYIKYMGNFSALRISRSVIGLGKVKAGKMRGKYRAVSA